MGVKTLSRMAIQRLVRPFGYELKVIGSPPCGYAEFLHRVAQFGIEPRVVFDVGVGNGTPWLYAAFPHAHFVLLEPQSRFEPILKDICNRLDAEYQLVGVGAMDDYRPIYNLLNSPTGSSFLKPNTENEARWGSSEQSTETLHIVPLDSYATRQGPFFLKIDTEGFELEVLRGATQVLRQTDVVLLEAAVAARQADEPGLIEVGAFMQQQGFALIDFPMLTQKSKNGSLLYVDAAFARPGRM